MSDKARWVKLPDGAQVTMGRQAFENTQRLGFFGKIGIAALVLFVFWLMGQGDDNPGTGPGSDNPRPSHSTSAPESVDHG